jgi:hypothetical protein
MLRTINAMGELTGGTAVIEATLPDHGEAPTNIFDRPSITARMVARLRARRLDRQIDNGATAEPSGAVNAHMWRLTSTGHREQLAAELRGQGAALLCHRVVLSPRSRVNVPDVWDAAALIERVEKRLLTEQTASARGAARLRLLLADRTGPMHRRGRGDLCTELRRVLSLL